MTFIQALFNDIETNWADVEAETIYFGTPEGVTGQFVVMNIVVPGERPVVLCEDQGEAGQADLQFSGVAASRQKAYNLLESCKDYVQSIMGDISIDAFDFKVDENITDGVRGFDASLNTWQALFEARFIWHAVV